MKTVLLVGNYGVGNLGDEALKEYFLQRFPEVQWRVISADPKRQELPRLPGGLRSLFTPWWRTLQGLQRADAVVFGGGTLFTDVESLYACCLWWWHAWVCKAFGKPIHLAFQGFGPFRTSIGKKLARSAVAMAKSVSVRDKLSYDRAKSWNKKVVLSFDPIYSEILALNRENSDSSIKNMFIILPRKNPSLEFMKVLQAQNLRDMPRVRIISMQPDSSEEQKVCRDIAEQMKVSTEIVTVRTLPELVSNCREAAFMLTQRFHGALVAAALHIPYRAIPQGPEDKLDALEREQNEDWAVRIKAGEEALREALL